jgi:hypothetical protein
MWRAKRIKEIAEANQPAFASTNAMEWWLDPGPEQHSALIAEPQPVADVQFVADARPVPALPALKAEVVESVREPELLAVAAAAPVSSAPVKTSSAAGELTWDPRACCFVSI